MEKEYAVVVKRGVDLAAFDAEMAASQGHGPVPDRAVQVADPRIGSRRMTHWMLTDTEAEQLRSDPRVMGVEIPPDQRDDIQIGLNGLQSETFYRGQNNQNTGGNWGLRRCVETTNVFGGQFTITNDQGYPYALDGTGVDIVIQDSGIEPNHPEWQDANGVSRLQQIDWGSDDIWGVGNAPFTQSVNHYRDYDGHGTHVASTAAGKLFGWAKNAHIYSQKLAGLEGSVGGNDSGTGIPIGNAFDAIRLWHQAKTNGRPTIVNMSWGYSGSSSSNPTSGNYRGTGWTYSTQTDQELWDDYGIVDKKLSSGTVRSLPSQQATVDAEVEDLIDAGVHVCIAPGNNYYKADLPGGADYDNTVVFGGFTRFYNRPSSPYSAEAFIVGNIESLVTSGQDRTRASSTRGPSINIWAPGSRILGAMSDINDGDSLGQNPIFNYPDDASYKCQRLSGTSMASPQVAGVCALHLQVNPRMSPAELQNKIFAESVSDAVYETANNDTDYSEELSILGASNRFLYSKYGRQNPWSISRS